MPYQFEPPASARRIAKRTSWFPNSYMSPGLLRAREQYRTRNLLVGIGILGFVFGVYAYSIRSVEQDDFSDVVDLTAEERTKAKSIEDKTKEAALGAVQAGANEVKATVAATGEDTLSDSLVDAEWYESMRKQGYQQLWTSLLATGFRGKGVDSPLVQGSPDVDRVGKLGDRTSEGGKRLV
jgi:cytochrome c oxidase assembly factor 3